MEQRETLSDNFESSTVIDINPPNIQVTNKNISSHSGPTFSADPGDHFLNWNRPSFQPASCGTCGTMIPEDIEFSSAASTVAISFC